MAKPTSSSPRKSRTQPARKAAPRKAAARRARAAKPARPVVPAARTGTKTEPRTQTQTKTRPRTKARPRAQAKTRTQPARSRTGQPRTGQPLRRTRTRRAPSGTRGRRARANGLGPSLSSRGAVVSVLDAERPVDALRGLLGELDGIARVPEAQIALGAAQLLLLPVAREHRGGPEVHEIVDLVLDHWHRLPDRAGFHAQEFLRNALAASGDDRARIARLSEVVPFDASPELRFDLARAYAVAGERLAMLREIRTALALGVTASQVLRERDFASYADDPQLLALLERARSPIIPVDVQPHVPAVRAALDSVVRTLRELGQTARLAPPASLDAVLAAERAARIQLPNDYRALLTMTDGLQLWENAFLGTDDYRAATSLARDARDYLERSRPGLEECIPLVNCGQPSAWLLYDPRGTLRNGDPGYVLMADSGDHPLDGLAHALERFERVARDVLGTN